MYLIRLFIRFTCSCFLVKILNSLMQISHKWSCNAYDNPHPPNTHGNPSIMLRNLHQCVRLVRRNENPSLVQAGYRRSRSICFPKWYLRFQSKIDHLLIANTLLCYFNSKMLFNTGMKVTNHIQNVLYRFCCIKF